jgi:type IV pilus assembly protein PilE
MTKAVGVLGLVGGGRQRGFTLMELMVVVAIVGILAAIAYPSYQEQVRSTRRADAQAALVAFAAAMERHHTQQGTYEKAATGGADTGIPATTVFVSEAPLDGATKTYNLTISAATRNTYTLLATPKGPQVGDGDLRVDSVGRKEWNRKGAGTWVSW